MSTLEERLLGMTETGPECWTWVGTLNRKNGYGHIRDGAMKMAHRVSYELFVGPIPEGATIDHLCRNRLCVKPQHLEAVSIEENIRRAHHCSPCTCEGR
jgi:hypothetical protein